LVTWERAGEGALLKCKGWTRSGTVEDPFNRALNSLTACLTYLLLNKGEGACTRLLRRSSFFS